METYQWILVGLSVLIGFSMVPGLNFGIFFSRQLENLKVLKDKIVKKLSLLKKRRAGDPNISSKTKSGNGGLIEVVSAWNSFKSLCEKNNLSEVCDKLYEIFPLLVKKEEQKEELEKTDEQQV